MFLLKRKKTNRWLANQLGKDEGTVSKWCTNTMQPNLETLRETAMLLDVNVTELLWPTKKIVMLEYSIYKFTSFWKSK